jgi:RHS repeat-associated protein
MKLRQNIKVESRACANPMRASGRGVISRAEGTTTIARSPYLTGRGNGNLTNDGLRSFVYDSAREIDCTRLAKDNLPVNRCSGSGHSSWIISWAKENQLIQVWVNNQWLSQFAYDGKMRRRIRQECTWQGGVWVRTNQVYYVYDGNEVIQERDVNNLPTITYTRGKDLSGSLEGAGGIGGLLSMTLNVEPGTLNFNSSYYHSDGNGNVTMLINASQAIVAKYLYDAFGNTLSAAGSLAQANLYRFSSKEAHPNSGLVYYLYRYYDPNFQRWLNRDPFLEPGFEMVHNPRLRRGRSFLQPAEGFEGPNIYVFVRNNSLNGIDELGLEYGNPVSGPNGPVGPSDPWAPGGAYCPHQPPPPPKHKHRHRFLPCSKIFCESYFINLFGRCENGCFSKCQEFLEDPPAWGLCFGDCLFICDAEFAVGWSVCQLCKNP